MQGFSLYNYGELTEWSICKGGEEMSFNDGRLSEKVIGDALSGVAVKVYSEIDSTNTEAKRLSAADQKAPVLLLAEGQTAGRGRMGRQFFSPQSTGLYMSYMYCPEASFADSVTVTSAAAVAVAKAIEELTDLKPQIKWVNDIYINGKKVCGILTEAVTGQKTHIIVGIGVNITTEIFPDELKATASSLGKTIDRNKLAVLIVGNLTKLIAELHDRTFIEDYRQRSLVLGREVVFTSEGRQQAGRAVGIDRDGGLIVETPDGTTVLNTGEISLKII